MNNVNSIKYLSICIKASGFGCVNTNGNMNPENGQEGIDKLKNVIFPKSRNGQMYISNNCIRNGLFCNDAIDMAYLDSVNFKASDKNGAGLISKRSASEISQTLGTTFMGLMRGYLKTVKDVGAIKRNSPLMITDFVNTTNEVNYREIGVNHLAFDEKGNKDKNSLYSARTWGKTEYVAEAIIDIEALRSIQLDNRLDSASVCFGMDTKSKSVQANIDEFIEKLEAMIKALAVKHNMQQSDIDNIKATHGLFTMNSVFVSKTERILLSDEAVHALCLEMISRIKNLAIIKARGYMKVTNADVVAQHTASDEGVSFDANVIPEYYNKLNIIA